MHGAHGIGTVMGRKRNCRSGSGPVVLGPKCAVIVAILKEDARS